MNISFTQRIKDLIDAYYSLVEHYNDGLDAEFSISYTYKANQDTVVVHIEHAGTGHPFCVEHHCLCVAPETDQKIMISELTKILETELRESIFDKENEGAELPSDKTIEKAKEVLKNGASGAVSPARKTS